MTLLLKIIVMGLLYYFYTNEGYNAFPKQRHHENKPFLWKKTIHKIRETTITARQATNVPFSFFPPVSTSYTLFTRQTGLGRSEAGSTQCSS
jgi:lysozyme family protein